MRQYFLAKTSPIKLVDLDRGAEVAEADVYYEQVNGKPGLVIVTDLEVHVKSRRGRSRTFTG